METYPYVDADGQLVQEVVREECSGCGPAHKQFRQVFVVAAGRRVKRKPTGFQPVLYRLPQVLEAVTQGMPVWLLEGEKDVATAERLGHVATTNTQGGQAFPAELACLFGGADVRVVLDRDEAGWSRGVGLHHVLAGVAAQVRLFLPATTAAKSDFTDHVEAGHDVGALLQVHVEEVAAWATMAAARKKHGGVEQALAETQAQLASGADVDQAGTADAAAEHKRFARRWAVESEIRLEALREIVEDVRGHVTRTGTDWAAEALAAAEDVLRLAMTAARAAHHAVGLAVPPALQEPAETSSTAPSVDGTSSGRDQRRFDGPRGEVREGIAIDQPTFRIVNRQIVMVDRGRNKRSDEWDDEENLKLILGLDVCIIEMEYLEEDAGVDVDAPRLMGREARVGQAVLNPVAPAELSAVVVAYTHPVTEETMQLRVTAEQWRDCSWLDSLPGPPDYDTKPSGLATVRRAIRAVSGEIRATERYRWTGWRHDAEGRWMFVHAGGAIGKDGARPAPVLLSGPLARYDLPDPCTDPARLRAAFSEASGGWLDRFPARVAAPLLGHVYRSALGPNPWVLALVGSPGSYKTSMASLAMHHWGELWDRRKPASSLSGNGDTLNALRIKLNSAKDALYWADDVAPTRDWGAAQKTLEEFARLVHNGEQRSRSTRDGLTVLDGTPPRSSALVTSEVMPRPGSGAQRMLVVPLQADEIDLDDLIAMDSADSRHGRALLMASVLQWLAGDLEEIRRRCLLEASRYADGMRMQGESVRQAEAIGHTWAGWILMTDFLLATGSITPDECDQVLAEVDKGLHDAVVAAADPDLPTRTGARVRELLAHALRTGLVYVDDVRTGEPPPWPLAGRLGWRRSPFGFDEAGNPRYRMESRGLRFGYVLHDPDAREGCAQLLVESPALEQALQATAKTMADAPQIDRGTAIRALFDEGVLMAEERTGKTPRFTVQRTLHCEDGRRQRMTVLRLVQLLGDEPDEDRLPIEDAPTGDSDGTVGGLFTPPPSPVDVSQHPRLESSSPPQGLTSPQDEENLVRTFPDSEGTQAAAESTMQTADCLMCGLRCGIRFLGEYLHIPCWQRSTAQSRTAAATQRQALRRPVTGESAVADTRQTPQTRRRAAPTAVGQRIAGTPNDFVAPAAVLDSDGVWLPDGTRHDLPEPLRHVGHVANLVEHLRLGVQVTDRRAEPGQVWVTSDALTRLGIDVDQLPADPTRRSDAIKQLTKGSALVSDALKGGWQLGGTGDSLGAWTRVWTGDRRGVWVALVSAMDPQLPVLADLPEPATLARRLAMFAGALRAPWAMSPATTGIDLMVTLRARDRDRLFKPRDPVPPARVSTLEQDLNWSRPPSEVEQQARFVHAYDRGGSYAAGIAGLELGIGDPTHHGDGCRFDAKLPGYWRFELPEAADWRMPHPLNPRGQLPRRPVWATTPAVQLAYELGYEVPILEAYTWAEHGRILDPWYERIRDARSSLDIDDVDAQCARDLLKVVYTRSIGMMGSEEWMRGRTGYAPDRRHHIVAKARSNILRRIMQIGRDSDRWPIAVTADTVLYVSDEPDPVAAWPGKPQQLGRGFGQFKPEASGILADQRPFLTGQDYRGKDHLDHNWDPSVAVSSTRDEGAA